MHKKSIIRRRQQVERTCINCGESFFVSPCVVADGGAKYCSRACYVAQSHTRARCICEQCGTEFLVKPSRVKNGTVRFCSFACRDAHHWPASQREESFWSKVDKSGECWLWTGQLNPNGYGVLSIGRDRKIGAHAFAWFLATGEHISPGMNGLHTCDIRNCVRNDDEGFYEVNGVLRPRRGHIFIGTLADNNADMYAKGRGRPRFPSPLRGEDSPTAKLTEDQVRAIRRRYADGDTTKAQLAREYGVTFMAVTKIIRRQNWAHVE